MGRPLNKKYFGNRNIGSVSTVVDDKIGGSVVGGVVLATNNSVGYTTGSAATFTAPELPRGVTATGTITTFAIAGALTDVSTYTRAGTSVAASATYTAVVQKGGTGGGTGAVFTITKPNGGTTYASVTIVVTSAGSAYTVGSTIVIDGALLGGVTVTNDLTLTVATFVGTTGTISGFVITNTGSGYTAAPTISAIAAPGTVGTTTYVPTLTVDTGIVGTVSNQENAILAYAWTGAARELVDIVKQEASRRYAVRTASVVSGEPWLVRSAILVARQSQADTDGNNQFNEMDITATDSAGNAYWVLKLTAHKALLVRKISGNGQFADPTLNPNGQVVAWTMNDTSGTKGYTSLPYLQANVNVKIANG